MKNKGRIDERFKVHLLAQGFMKRNIESHDATYSPIARLVIVQTVLSDMTETNLSIGTYI